MALPDYYALVGLQTMMEREEGYDRAAAAVVTKPVARSDA